MDSHRSDHVVHCLVHRRWPSAIGVLQKPAYVQSLTSLLGNAPSWTKEILKKNGRYVSGLQFHEEIAGTRYELFDMCVRVAKCIDTSIIVMFAPNGTQAWAGLSEKGVISFLGAPSDAQQAVLKRQLYVPEPRHPGVGCTRP